MEKKYNSEKIKVVPDDLDALDLDRFTNPDKLLYQLQECGQLHRECYNLGAEYIDQLKKRDKSYFDKMGMDKEAYQTANELTFINSLLYPSKIVAKYPVLSEAEKQSECSLVIELAKELVELLNEETKFLKTKYLNQTPLEVENYILHWETMIDYVEGWTAHNYHTIRKNPLFPFVQKWLADVRAEYSFEKLSQREQQLKAFKAQISLCNSTKEKSGNNSNPPQSDYAPTKLTYLLERYYLNGCRSLNKQQVEKLAAEKDVAKSLYVNRWIALKIDGYVSKANRQSAKEFIRSYEYLMQCFENTNPTAFQDVRNKYLQLKETYPDLTY